MKNWIRQFAQKAKREEEASVQFMYNWLKYLDEINESDGPKAVVKEVKDMMIDLKLTYPDALNDA